MAVWQETYQQARLEEQLADGSVRCHLSPRNCVIKEGQFGFCGVRGNRDGHLVTYSYGKGVHATEERIETEAVFHFEPGARILSLGNIGCMLNCTYCQNWKTSQARFVEDHDVHSYTPEGIIETALRHGIRVLSWTYNDPVVWHEFVRDTARLAKEAGLINLFKSAFYITIEAVDELLPYIDIFSISLKSLDEKYYPKVTAGEMQPVLDATKHVYNAGKHVEVSTLMITDLSDDEDTARKITDWVLRELDATVPMHFVRFHPDYRLRNTIRTPIPRLLRAQAIAREMGVEHVYVGNVNDPEVAKSCCAGCGATLVTRFGLNARNVGLDERGHCAACGRDAHFKLRGALGTDQLTVPALPAADFKLHDLDWHGDIALMHIEARNPTAQPASLYYRRRDGNGANDPWQVLTLTPGESYRFALAKASPGEIGPELAIDRALETNLHEVYDRAHFPTVTIDEGVADNDVTPLPHYEGKQNSVENLHRFISGAA